MSFQIFMLSNLMVYLLDIFTVYVYMYSYFELIEKNSTQPLQNHFTKGCGDKEMNIYHFQFSFLLSTFFYQTNLMVRKQKIPMNEIMYVYMYQ